jgi:hypothetical protein
MAKIEETISLLELRDILRMLCGATARQRFISEAGKPRKRNMMKRFLKEREITCMVWDTATPEDFIRINEKI